MIVSLVRISPSTKLKGGKTSFFSILLNTEQFNLLISILYEITLIY